MTGTLGGLRYALVGLAVVAAALVVATSGAPGSDVVTAGETDVLEMTPHEDADGIYTSIDENGEIQIHVAEVDGGGDGVNRESVYDLGPIFTIENVAHEAETVGAMNATVWLNHDSEHVRFHEPDGESLEGEISDGLLQGTADQVPDNAVTLQPGESVTVALTVDSRGTDEITLESFNVAAVLDAGIEDDEDSGEGDTGDGDTGDGDTGQGDTGQGDTGDGDTGQGDTGDGDTDTGSGDSSSDDTDTETGSGGDGDDGTAGGAGAGTPTPTPTPTPTEESTTGDEPVETPIEFAGVSPWWLLLLLALLVLLLALLAARRRFTES